MYACHHHFWRLGRFTCMAGVNMDEEVKAGEWIGKHLFAFPANHYDLADSEHGLTMRDYFAAKAMQGFLASPLLKVEMGEYAMAKNAYRVADSMMEARKE